MNSKDSLYIGIDPSSGTKEFGYAMIDGALDLVALSEADLEEVVDLLSGQEAVVVAINAPKSVNRGLVKDQLAEAGSGPRRSVRGVDIRMAEYELRERGISIAGTPAREQYCPSWMQAGFALYSKLAAIGFKPYGEDGASCQVLETHPFACFCVLAESIPFPKLTLEGRLQRQLLLSDKGLHIRDAMGFFEEITRFKLMRGILPTDVLYSPEQLDLLVAAYTAWLADRDPEAVIMVGDKEEGQIFLPARSLKQKY